MELWLAVGGLLGALGVAVGSIAHRNQQAWPIFRDRVYWTGSALLIAVMALGTGLFFSLLFSGLADQALEVGSATGAICTGLIGILAFAWIADRLRKPD